MPRAFRAFLRSFFRIRQASPTKARPSSQQPSPIRSSSTPRSTPATAPAPQENGDSAHSPVLKMATDEEYMDFLEKANRDPNEGFAPAQVSSQSTSRRELKAQDAGASVPAAIKAVTTDKFFTSEADEPFVPVVLAWDEAGKTLPDEEEFAKLIEHWDPSNANIEIQDPFDWDSEGRYTDIIDAVRKAGKGSDVRVYRVAKDGTRVEYWVVTCEGRGKDARLVGVKALAIES